MVLTEEFKKLPVGTKEVTTVHSHACDWPTHQNEIFSQNDIEHNHVRGLTGYMVTPSGAMYKHDPKEKTIRCLGDLAPNVKVPSDEIEYQCPVEKRHFEYPSFRIG